MADINFSISLGIHSLGHELYDAPARPNTSLAPNMADINFLISLGIHSLGHELYDAPARPNTSLAPNMADINFSISLGFIPWAMNSTTPQPEGNGQVLPKVPQEPLCKSNRKSHRRAPLRK
jgi:hypothetical protein